MITFQSERVDFIKLMLEANEAKGKITDADLEMTADHNEEDLKEGRKDEGEGHVKINKQMTMEVAAFLIDQIQKYNQKAYDRMFQFYILPASTQHGYKNVSKCIYLFNCFFDVMKSQNLMDCS